MYIKYAATNSSNFNKMIHEVMKYLIHFHISGGRQLELLCAIHPVPINLRGHKQQHPNWTTGVWFRLMICQTYLSHLIVSLTLTFIMKNNEY